jgi:hypothetical protein
MSLVQEAHVSDAEESRILEIFEFHAQDAASFEAFVTAVNRRHFWSGTIVEHYQPLLASILEELEGGRNVRVRELLGRSRQEHIRNYQPPDQITFAESFWEDLSEGQIRDQIFAYFQGIGDAGVAMAESVVLLIRDPGAFAEGIARLPETARLFWQNREQLWRSFLAATPEEQARMIGRITGEFELFLASQGAGAAGGAGRAGATTARAVAAGEVVVGAGGQAAIRTTQAVNLAGLGPRAAQLGQMAAHTAQAQGGLRSMREAADEAGDASRAADDAPRGTGGSTSNRGGGNSTSQGGSTRSGQGRPTSRPDDPLSSGPLTDAEIDSAMGPLRNPETGQAHAGAMLDDVLVHEQASDARRVAGAPGQPLPGRPGRTPQGVDVNPNPGHQSAHLGPQSALRDLPQYNPNEMLTRLLPTGRGQPHTVFDQHWQRQFREIRSRTGRQFTTAQELYDVVSRSLTESGAFSPQQAESLRLMFSDELFGRLRLAPDTQLRMPGT